jgi:probable metal-binding protein
MFDKIHGHEVMRMMVESGKQYTRESLREAIHDAFGESTRFYTCSVENMTADELIDFLVQRGKFIGEEENFTTHPDKICDH